MDPRLAAAGRRFGFSLLSWSIEQDGLRNRFYSPLSITLALSMLYNGATGMTQQEMARVLGIEGLSRDEVNAANAALLARVQHADPKVQIHSAQSLWLHHVFSLQPTFAQRVQQFYQGAVRTLDFTSPAAVPTINRWVSDETNGKIDQLIQRIDKEILFLLNAIYFKAAWEQPFDRRMTQDSPFTLLDGQRSPCQ